MARNENNIMRIKSMRPEIKPIFFVFCYCCCWDEEKRRISLFFVTVVVGMERRGESYEIMETRLQEASSMLVSIMFIVFLARVKSAC